MKIWVKIKDILSTAKTPDEMQKEYPVLKHIPKTEDIIECYALFESAKWQKRYSIAFIVLTIITISLAIITLKK